MNLPETPSLSVDDPSSTIEQLAPGVTIEWLHDKKIIVVTSHDTARTSVDSWMNRSADILQNWPSDRPYLCAIDASDPNVTRTPYSQGRLKELRTLRPDLKRYMALIPPKTYVMQLMQLSMKLPTSREEMKIFFTRDEAIKWLQSKI